MRTYVNLGCGAHYHPAWTNFDIVPQGADVIQADLSRGIPLGDGVADVVYHSAVLEHIRREHAPGFLRECRRVLKPGGVLRVAVPDLEGICRVYLEKLQAARAGDAVAAADRDWMVLELLDQCVRERSGGEMLAYFRQSTLPHESFVLQRIGAEGREMLDKARSGPGRRASLGERWRKAGRQWRRILQLPGLAVTRLLLGAQGREALRIGAFRLGGEVHQWMYDDHSLARLLTEAGFVASRREAADTSRIAGWAAFNLDTLPDGSVRKPDLFYMEAVNPAE